MFELPNVCVSVQTGTLLARPVPSTLSPSKVPQSAITDWSAALSLVATIESPTCSKGPEQ